MIVHEEYEEIEEVDVWAGGRESDAEDGSSTTVIC